MSQNPYAAPVAKLEYERLGKENQGPLAEYKYAKDVQGYKGTLQEFKQSMRPLPSVTNVNMPTSMAPMFVRNRITGKNEYVQPDNRGNFNMANYEPVPTQTPLAQELADAGITPDNPKFQELAQAFINKKLTQVIAPNATVVSPTGSQSQATPAPSEGTTNIMIDGKLTAVPIAQAAELNAKYEGQKTAAQQGAIAALDLVTVYDKEGKASFVPRSQAVTAANTGNPLLAKPDVKTTQGQAVLDLAERAKKALPQSSSGLINSLFTMATDAAGIPTNMSKADGQLRVIAGALTSNIPRMEGPQSDADRLLYQQSAADVANTNKPYQSRMAALETVIGLNEKYAATPTAPPPGSVRRITPK